MRRLGMVAIASAVTAGAGGAHAQPELFDYVVKPGDTCDGIAGRIYGDASRIDLLHNANPGLGPLPHHLKPGSVLRLPPDASIAYVRNHVDAFTPGQHPGRANEALMRGHRVGTYDSSGAEVVFADDAVLQLGEDTLVVILGASHGSVTKTASAADTTLVNGSLRTHLAELAGRPASATVSTPAGHHVDVGAGEAQVTVDHQQTTRLAVYVGGGKLTAKKQTVVVPQGFGSRAEKDAAPTPPRALPPAPEWAEALPAVAFTASAADVAGRFQPGTGPGPAPAGWHVQLSRDDRYDDVVVDARLGLDTTRLEARALPAGKYYARVSAIDADHFEGPSTPTAVVVVAPLEARASGAGGQAGIVDLPADLYCGLDGAPLAPSGSLQLLRGPAHVLRCAADAEGHRATETTLPAASVGPLRVEAALDPTGPGEGVVRLRLADAVGAPLRGSGVSAVAGAGGKVRGVSPAVEPGRFDVAVAWQPGTPALLLRVTVNGVDRVDVPEVPLPPPPAPPRSRVDRLELALLAGAAVATTPFTARPSLAPSFGGEIGWMHTFAGYSVDVAARGTWEHTNFSSTATPPTYDLYGLGVPVVLRLGGPAARWVPFAGLEPGLVIDVVRPTYAPVGFAGTAMVGVARRTGMGEAFVELGYRVTSSFLPYGDGTHDALFAHLGYRLDL